MALDPLLDQRIAVGGGTGALLALPLVQAAADLAAHLPVRAEDEPDASAKGAQQGGDDSANAPALDAT